VPGGEELGVGVGRPTHRRAGAYERYSHITAGVAWPPTFS